MEKLIRTILTISDDLTSPTAKEIYAGAVAIVSLVIIAELVLGMF